MTSNLKLHQLVLENFGPFIGRHELDVPETGLVMVVGENCDTDESSGSGKSSLIESLAYAFDYSTFASTDLQSWDWLTDDPMSVGLQFTSPFGEVSYERSKKSFISLDGGPKTTSAKSVKEALHQYVGVRPEILKALTYRAQGQPGFFLSLTDQEKKSFLTELLGLQRYETEVERIVKVVSDLETGVVRFKTVADTRKSILDATVEPVEPTPLDTAALDAKIATIEVDIQSYQDRLTCLKTADDVALSDQKDRESNVHRHYRPLVQTAQQKVSEVKNQKCPASSAAPVRSDEIGLCRKRLATLQDAIAKKISENTTKIREIRQQVNTRAVQVARDKSTSESKMEILESKRNNILQEITVLQENKCFTCNRTWDEAASNITTKKSILAQIDIDIGEAFTDINLAIVNENDIASERIRLSELESIDPVPAKFRDGVEEYTSKLNTAESDYKVKCQKHASECAAAERLFQAQVAQSVAESKSNYTAISAEYQQKLYEAQEMTNDHVKIRENMAMIKDESNKLRFHLQSAKSTLENSVKDHTRAMAEYHRAFMTWNQENEAYQTAVHEYKLALERVNQERDCLECIRAFLGLVFDQTLDRVAFLTNSKMAQVPNIQDITLSFISERETKTTKNVRQEIRPVIERDGHAVPLKRLSGGQQASLNLAVDLGLAEVISERTGIAPGWLVLDEAFNGLPLKSKQSCFEMLKSVATEKLILVIDHTRELQDMCDSVVTVRSQGGVSKLVI